PVPYTCRTWRIPLCLRRDYLPQVNGGGSAPRDTLCDDCARLCEVEGHAERLRDIVGGAQRQDADRQVALCDLDRPRARGGVSPRDNCGHIALSPPAAAQRPRRIELLHEETHAHPHAGGLEYLGRGRGDARPPSVGILDEHHPP